MCPADVLNVQSLTWGKSIQQADGVLKHALPLPEPRVPLHLCASLAPAATGTMFVANKLKQMQLKLDGVASVRHNHMWRASGTWPGRRTAAAADGRRCLVLTVREPSERLASGMRYDADSCPLPSTIRTGGVCLHSPKGFASLNAS